MKINYKEVALGVALVLLGFCLAVIWDNIKDIKREKAERESLVIMVQLELANIYGTIDINIKTIQTNLKKLEAKSESVSPLVLFETSAWESAKLRNNVFIKNTGDLLKVVHLYTAIHVINEKVRFRENFRMANQAMPNYTERMKMIDSDISQNLEKAKGLLTSAQDFFDKNYPFLVKGYSFLLDDKGMVNEVKNSNTKNFNGEK